MSDSIRTSVSEILKNKNGGDPRAALLLAMIHLEAGRFHEAEMSALGASSLLGELSKRNIVNNIIGLRGRIIEYTEKLRENGNGTIDIAQGLEEVLKISE